MEYVFDKYRVNGNDYLVFDANRFQYELTKEQIRKICGYHFGVGLRGLMMGPYFIDNKISVRMFHSSGCEEEKNDNGILIFAQFLRDYKYVQDSSFILNTTNGPAEIEFRDEIPGTVRFSIPNGYPMELKMAVGSNSSAIAKEEYCVGLMEFKDGEAAQNGATLEKSNRNNCVIGTVREIGKIITADHFIEGL